MSAFPGSPRLVKGGLVLLDPDTSVVKRVIVLQYNPETLTRTLQPQAFAGESGDREEALRLKGPPVETFRVEAEIDAADQMETAGAGSTVAEVGIHPQIAALETIVYPSSSRIQSNDTLAGAGTIEIAPLESPLVLFVWSRQRIVPVRITEFSITEEMFDPALNPIRAKITLSMRALSVNDLPSGHKGWSLFMSYQQQKERLAAAGAGPLGALGLSAIP
ncbi:MAG: hypothetical protein IT158_30060 [Bryobacterales bacterium]|nr:hypothetical protein [Bryobacterales bacterium]